MNNYDNKIDFHLETQNASYESFITAWDVAHHVISMTKRAPAGVEGGNYFLSPFRK